MEGFKIQSKSSRSKSRGDRHKLSALSVASKIPSAGRVPGAPAVATPDAQAAQPGFQLSKAALQHHPCPPENAFSLLSLAKAAPALLAVKREHREPGAGTVLPLVASGRPALPAALPHAQVSAAPLWSVEGWRAVAALLVLWAHWGPPLGWPGTGPQGLMLFAFTGVDLFFVLSGFVFAPVLLERPLQSLSAYALRRVLRIYPAYLAALALYVLLAWQAGRPLLHVPEHLLMAHLQSREMAFYYNPAFWSLPVEVEFYVLVPLLGAWMARGRVAARQPPGRWRHWRWPLLCLVALAMRLVVLGQADSTAQNFAYVLLNHAPGLLVEFFLGAWVWQRAQRPLARSQAWAWGAGGLAGWCVLATLFVQLRTTVPAWLLGQLGLCAAACFAALLLASLQMAPPGRAVLATARWGGRLSYSLYLLHMAWLAPALAWAGRWGAGAGSALALAGLLACCLALHWCIEEPCRRWGRSRARHREQGGTQQTAV